MNPYLMRRVLLLLLLGPLAAAADPVGEARSPTGRIEFRRETDGEFRTLGEAAATVFNLDVWRTGPEATLEVYLDNGTILTLGPDTETIIRLDEAERTLTLELLRGSLKVVTINSPEYRTTVLTPSAFVQAAGGILVASVPSEGDLHVEAEQGELTVVHNYGTMLSLAEGQAIDLSTDFDQAGRVFTVRTAVENAGPVGARIVERIRLGLPPGTTTTVTDDLVPGDGGELIVEAGTDNLDIVTIEIGEPEMPEQVHQTDPGERVVIRFGRPTDDDLEIEVGDNTPRAIPRPGVDDPFEVPGDLIEAEGLVPVVPVIPDQAPASPIQ